MYFRRMDLSLDFVKSGNVMGGRGSGGHNAKGKLRDVQCARLDVHELKDGKKQPATLSVEKWGLKFQDEAG